MKLIFWNVQRVGGGSDEDKLRCVDLVIQHQLRPLPEPYEIGLDAMDIEDGPDVDGIVLCEITSDATYGDYHIEKIGAVSKRGRRAFAQLGYGGVMWSGEPINLVEEQIASHQDIFQFPFHLRGGNSFMAHSKRKVMRIHGTEIFVYHANASTKAEWVVHWAAGHLKLRYPNYILIGDLNCHPSEFQRALQYYDNIYANGNVFAPGAYIASYSKCYDQPTHHVRHGLASTLDWAVCSPQAMCDVTTLYSTDLIESTEPEVLGSHPDHLPILLDVW